MDFYEEKRRWLNSGIKSIVPYDENDCHLEGHITHFVSEDYYNWKTHKYERPYNPLTKRRLKAGDPNSCPFDMLSDEQIDYARKITNLRLLGLL